MPAKDHLDKQGRHLPTLAPMQVPQDVLVGAGDGRVTVAVVTGEGQAQTDLSDPELRGLIVQLGSAWWNAYGEKGR